MTKRVRNGLAIAVAMGVPAVALGQQLPQGVLEQNERQQQAQQADEREEQQQAAQRRSAGFRGEALQQGEKANRELVNYLAAKLLIANQCQIETADMAAKMAESEQVKQFANQVKQESTRINQQLTNAIPGLRSVPPITSAAGRQGGASPRPGERPRQIDPQRDAARPGAAQQARGQQGERFLDGGAQQLLDVTRRAAQINHEAVKQFLSEKRGQEFDKCFVGQEIGANMWMAAELKAIENLGPEQFTGVVQQAQSAVQQQLDMAKQLAQSLESQPRGSGARPTGPGQQFNE